MTKSLPEQANLNQQKSLAKELLKSFKNQNADSIERIRKYHPLHPNSSDGAILKSNFTLRDAQLVVAREYGFENWKELRLHINQSLTPNSPWGKFVSAIRDNNKVAAETILAQNPELVNMRSKGSAFNFGQTNSDPVPPEISSNVRSSPPLHHCVLHNKAEIAELLLKSGADVNALGWDDNHENAFPLTLAGWMGSPEVVELLFRYGANPNPITNQAHPGLYSAAEHHHKQKIRVFEQFGAHHDIFTSSILGDVEKVREFVESDIEVVRKKSHRNRSPIEEAIFHGQTETVDYLIAFDSEISLDAAIVTGRFEDVTRIIKANPDLLNPSGLSESQSTPLMTSVKSGKKNIVKLLLQLGADVNLGVGNGDKLCQPIHVAHSSTISILVNAGADVNRVYRGFTPLQRELNETNDPTKIKELLKHGADIHRGSADNKIPLEIAMNRGKAECVQLLLDNGAPTKFRAWDAYRHAEQLGNEEITTLLNERRKTTDEFVNHLLSGDSTEATRMLRSNDSLVNVFDNSHGTDKTPLMLAVEHGDIELVNLLISKGANVHSTYYASSMNALTLAIYHEHKEIIHILREHGVESDDVTNYIYAAEMGNLEKVKMYLDSGVDVNAKDNCMHHAFGHAYGSGNETLITYLLDKGADVNKANGWGGWIWIQGYIKGGDLAKVRRVLDLGYDVNHKEEWGATCLQHARDARQIEMEQLLIEYGASE